MRDSGGDDQRDERRHCDDRGGAMDVAADRAADHRDQGTVRGGERRQTKPGTGSDGRRVW
jgi:hypothetical protein